ncbi:MAG: purine-nucleoside phosphorylase [Nitrospirae bacterium]|nr:purine-nucleoside phosphorylase [Nitrospirota bacterium]
MPDIDDKTRRAVGFIRAKSGRPARTGIILGSGLGSLADCVEGRVSIPYQSIPGFPVSSVKGHKGELVLGTLSGIPVAVMQGRFHHYEGYGMPDVTLPVRVMAGLGVDTLVVTNASGGIREDLAPGTFMAVTDHINMMGVNPLAGLPQGGDGGRDVFVDMTDAYDPGLAGILKDVAAAKGIYVSEGVLAAVSGPCYETPAEVRMLRALGADAVCMSTVPEVIIARYLGLRVLGLSLVTNRAAGLGDSGPEHEEVLEVAGSRHADFAALVEGFVGMAAG